MIVAFNLIFSPTCLLWFLLLSNILSFPFSQPSWNSTAFLKLTSNNRNSKNSALSQDPCSKFPLTPELWNSLELDEYLRNYPGGQNLSLQAYVEKIGAINFECGIGRTCTADEICMPVRGRDWYVLVATQNWNFFRNELFRGTAFAFSIVQGLATSLVNDFAPHISDTLAIQSTFLGVFAGLCGAIPGFLFPQSIAFFGSKIWPFVQGDTGLIAGTAWTYHNIWAPLPSDEFSKAKDVEYLLSRAQAETQQKINVDTTKVMRHGISTDEGLYGVLRNGFFLDNHNSDEEISEGDLQAAMSSVAKARLLAAMWKALGYFIVRGNTSCTHDGLNGALSGIDVLSYCNKDGIMMNIAQSYKGKLVDRFLHAPLLQSKYNMTVQYLVEQSWDCQQKYTVYCYDPYENRVLPPDPQAACIVSFAVCDMTREDIRQAAKKKGILRACREVGRIPRI
ncbi:hypothetical protein O181_012654 [Austropuccinia psidii MF-1]|uniref:DUF7872 domain-containing protein n=1 Tax=Austropuccinia psidii MF-1 TaxID=1389203 RepID=A0A9Q3BWR6_9BASI|nr:hypothetical protein [Austropuccinia psidii MF-1]